ncbi:TIGR02996 domain-containing protein [Gemmata sp. G18]|uniref:TIGR02996 domain-containing protein n=1 Tax=Gemmata palustris TaxID=2822762 RepID=A0ABS5C3E9_9BACT|nr:TIGR02996 domain-containing protein [Gemmata palustris]MBP3959683.1 TIGR02996 domain-containing protein [Gemmata palustris]
MSDRDALVSAICDQPDEDTPRLVFADYLEEHDEAAHAAFIRAQVALARTPPWEPFAVRCKWREPNVLSGRAFRSTLPTLAGVIEWAPAPFRRGFGWWLDVIMASEWDARIAPLFDRAPIGKVTFRVAPLDDWRRVAGSDRLGRLREIAFATSPIEPLFALRDANGVERVTDLHFNRASGAGMPEVIEDLFRSYLGRVVRGLHFHMGYESRDAILDAINTGAPLERLSFSVMGLSADSLHRLFGGPAANALDELHFINEPLANDGLRVLAETLPPGLRDLTLVSVGMRADGLEVFARSDRLTNLRRLKLPGNALTPRAVKVLSLTHSLTALRAIDLSGCHIGDKGVRHITQAKWWHNLVEVVLQRNSLSHVGVKHLLNAPVPPDLTALVLDRDTFGPESRAALVKKFGDAVVFVVPDPFG